VGRKRGCNRGGGGWEKGGKKRATHSIPLSLVDKSVKGKRRGEERKGGKEKEQSPFLRVLTVGRGKKEGGGRGRESEKKGEKIRTRSSVRSTVVK